MDAPEAKSVVEAGSPLGLCARISFALSWRGSPSCWHGDSGRHTANGCSAAGGEAMSSDVFLFASMLAFAALVALPGDRGRAARRHAMCGSQRSRGHARCDGTRGSKASAVPVA